MARNSAVKSRVAAIVQLGQVIVTAPAELRETITGRGLPAKARHCASFDVDTNRIAEPVEAARERTSTGSPTKPRSRISAASTPSPHHQARPSDIASTAVETVKPTVRYT